MPENNLNQALFARAKLSSLCQDMALTLERARAHLQSFSLAYLESHPEDALSHLTRLQGDSILFSTQVAQAYCLTWGLFPNEFRAHFTTQSAGDPLKNL